MSEKQLAEFLEEVKNNQHLQDKLQSAKDIDEVVNIATSEGYAITADPLKKIQHMISEQELEGVNAGFGTYACPGQQNIGPNLTNFTCGGAACEKINDFIAEKILDHIF